MPFALKSLIWGIYSADEKMLIMYGSLSGAERHLKHFDWPLTYFSLTDCVRSLFWVTRY